MKKLPVLVFVLGSILLFSGCGAEPFSPPSAVSPSPENTPEVSASPIVSSVVVSNRPTEPAAYEELTFGEYVYYLDPDTSEESGYTLSRKNIETGNVEITICSASNVYSFGDNQYADISISDDLLYPDWETHWITCRIDKTGRILKFIGGDSVLLQYDDSLYYTIYGEDCIFKSGLDCSDPVRIPIVPPENETPFEALSLTAKGRLTAMIDLYSIEDGWIYTGYDIINDKNQCLFSAGYNISLSDNHTEEEYPGTYYDNRIYKDSWLYYLDMENPAGSADSEEPLYYIHRMKEDGSGDVNLNVLCFSFDFAGEYLYADTNLTFGDFGHWDSYRYNLDGTKETKVNDRNMRRFTIDDRLYFTLFDDSAFFSATTACTNIKKYEVKLPDEEAIRENVGDCWECNFVYVFDEKDGWVYFTFEVTDTGPSTYYFGEYRMNLSSHKVEKVNDGEYFMDEGDGEGE